MIPLLVVGVLALAWVVGQFTIADLTTLAHTLVGTTFKPAPPR